MADPTCSSHFAMFLTVGECYLCIITGLRNSSVFITHLYRGIHPTDTKSGAYNNKCAISLGYCLKENNFRVQMDVPKQSRVPSNEDWRNWLDRKFSVVRISYIFWKLLQRYHDNMQTLLKSNRKIMEYNLVAPDL